MLLTNKNYGEKAQEKFTVVAHYQNYVIAIDEENCPYIHFGDFHVFPIGFQTESDSFIKLDRENCTTLLLQENPDLASDSLNKFLEDDLQFNQGKWIKDELNLFNTSEANYISKQLDKISIDSLSAYTKTKTIGISTPDWNIEL